MSAITATRTELMRRRSGIAFAQQGRDLLFDKRMALLRELHRLEADLGSERGRAEELGRRARVELVAAVVDEGPEAVEGAAAGTSSGLTVARHDHLVVGVRVVTVQTGRIRRSPEERGPAPALVAPSVHAAAETYELYLEQVLRFAALEATIRRLTREIARTTRQVNALENIVIPGLEAEVSHISQVLDEREREEHSRLKRARDRRATAQPETRPETRPTTALTRQPGRPEES